MAQPGDDKAEPFDRAIERLNRISIEAFNRGDIGTCAGLYDEDATMLLPDRPPIEGRKAIEDCLRDHAASGVTLMPVEPVTIVSNDDIGCCAGTYRFREPSGDSGAVTRTAKFVTVVRRQSDGSWKAVIDSFFADAIPD